MNRYYTKLDGLKEHKNKAQYILDVPPFLLLVGGVSSRAFKTAQYRIAFSLKGRIENKCTDKSVDGVIWENWLEQVGKKGILSRNIFQPFKLTS